MHLSEEHPDGIIILAIMQQEEACIARRDIGRDKEVVESINSLQGFNTYTGQATIYSSN